jgi:hypothetical protein
VTAVMAWIRRWYGAHPLHLLALLAAFALAGYAVRAVVDAGQWRGFAIWFAAAVIGHDLLLFPLYSLADLSLRRLLPRRAARTRGMPAGRPGGAARAGGPAQLTPPVINYIRIPAGLSLLLLAVWFPLILRLSSAAYTAASGLSASPYLWRWLAITGVLFTTSAVCYALSLRRTAARARNTRTHSGQHQHR